MTTPPTNYLFLPHMKVSRSGRDPNDFTKKYTQPEQLVKDLGVPGHTLVEYLYNQAVTKIFFDYDFRIPVGEVTPDIIREHEAKVLKRMDEDIMPKFKDFPGLSYVYATRHGPDPKDKKFFKISVRTFISGIRAVYTDIPIIMKLLGQDDGFWDKSVYKKIEQLFAAINGIKDSADPRVLTMQSEDKDLMKYVIQHTEPDWPLFEAPDDDITHKEEKRPERTTSRNKQNNNTTNINNPIAIGLGGPEVMLIRNILVTDAGLREFFGGAKNTSFNGLIFYEPKVLEDHYQYYVKHSSYVHCPIGNRVHNSNNCELNWKFKEKKLVYHCHDDECRAKFNTIDITQHLTIESIQSLGVDPLMVPGVVEMDGPMFIPDDDEINTTSVITAAAPSTVNTIEPIRQPAYTSAKSLITPWLSLMKKQWPDKFGDLEDSMFTVTKKDTKSFEFLWGGTSGKILANTSMIDSSGNFKGMIIPNHKVKGPLTYIHKDLPMEATECMYNQVSINESEIKSVTPDVKMHIKMIDSGLGRNRPPIVLYETSTKKGSIRTAGDVNTLTELINKYSVEHIEKTLKEERNTIIMNQNNSNNNTNSNNNINTNSNNNNNVYNFMFSNPTMSGEDDDDNAVLTNYALEKYPNVFSRFKLFPDTRNVIYFCCEQTNIWRKVTSIAMERSVVKCLHNDDSLSAKQKKFVGSRRGRADMAHCILSELVDEVFPIKLDKNLDILPFTNGAFDTSVKGQYKFRPIEMSDHVQLTTGYDYDPEKAEDPTIQSELTNFINTLIPVEAERDAFLTYMSGLISGRRRIKKFLAFTDKRAGNNGKSTLSQFLFHVFGNLTNVAGKKMLARATIEQGRNGHDAGLEQLRGARLIIAEELHNGMSLDGAFLKAITGGEGVPIQGRKLGASEQFHFIIQAGVLLVFNEGQCPKFDAADDALVNRMVVIPFRSKFISADEFKDINPAEMEEYTYPIDPELNSKFPSWASAFVKMLFDRYDPANVNIKLPESSLVWRTELRDDSNPLADFFRNHLEVTGDKRNDYVTFEQLRAMCYQNVTDKEFMKQYKAYLADKKGVKFVALSDFKGQKNVKGIARGVKLKESAATLTNHVDDESSLMI